MSRTALAKRVAATYMRQLFSFRTDIEDLEGHPTYVKRVSPAEEDAEEPTDTTEPLPQETSYKILEDGAGYITPVVPDDAVRR